MDAIISFFDYIVDIFSNLWNLIVGLINGITMLLSALMQISRSTTSGWMPTAVASVAICGLTLLLVLRFLGR